MSDAGPDREGTAADSPRNTKRLFMVAVSALFAALTAVLSQISINIGPIPINLALLAVFTAAGLLGPRYAALSQFIWLLMGLTGLPVFAGL